MTFFNRRSVNTPHPTNIRLDFKIVLDMTDDSALTLNGQDVSQVRNKRSGSYNFSQSSAVRQPRRSGKALYWDDPVNLQWLDAGSDYLFFDAADTSGAFLFAVASTAGSSPNQPFIFDFGQAGGAGWGISLATDAIVGYTPGNYGGAIVSAGGSHGTDYYVLGFEIKFEETQEIYLDNIKLGGGPISLLDLRNAYIMENPTRVNDAGPMTVGITSKTSVESTRSFRGGKIKMLIVGAGTLDAHKRKLLFKYLRNKGARV